MKKLVLGTMILIFLSLQLTAQNIDDLVKGGAADANYLVTGYASPAIKAFAGGLSQGWYNTADTHKFFGADLTISIGFVGPPSADKKFEVDNSKMTELQLDGTASGKGNIPTFFGSSKATNQTLSLKSNSLIKYDVPSGIGISRIPVPVANLGISLPKGFDLKFRYIPTINLGDAGSLGLWGVAVQHDIKQHIPGVKALPFSLALLVGYTKFTSTMVFDDTDPNNIQEGDFDVSSTTMQVLISKKISVLTIYGGVGYDIAKGSLAMKGTYDTNDDGDTTDPTDLKDPIDFSTKANSARVTAGLRLKFGPITLHGDYTLQNYSAITAGFGISVR
jgi:hypothetical protein